MNIPAYPSYPNYLLYSSLNKVGQILFLLIQSPGFLDPLALTFFLNRLQTS